MFRRHRVRYRLIIHKQQNTSQSHPVCRDKPFCECRPELSGDGPERIREAARIGHRNDRMTDACNVPQLRFKLDRNLHEWSFILSRLTL